MSDGIFLTIEGIDGSGTTTVVEAAEKRFNDVITTKEPAEQYWTGKATRRAINSDTHPMTDFHFFLGDRAHHIKNTIEPALDADKTVISDRYMHSTYAYQQENLKGVVDNPTHHIFNSMREWVIDPDLTILLDLPAEVAAKRTSDGDKYEASEFQKKVRQNYLDLADDDPTIITVDATQKKEKVIAESLTIVDETISQMAGQQMYGEEW